MTKQVSISNDTMNILKNFAVINPNLLVKKTDPKDKCLTTKAISDNMLATAKIEEVFPDDFAIYDLNEFLGVLSLFSEPVLHFDKESSVIVKEKNGKSYCIYYFANQNIIKYPNSNSIDVDVSDNPAFSLSEGNLNKIMKAVAALQVSDITIENNEGNIVVKVHDKNSPTSNSFDIIVGECAEDASFKLDIKYEFLKLIDDSYDVTFGKASNGAALVVFEGQSKKTKYWVALEISSTIG